MGLEPKSTFPQWVHRFLMLLATSWVLYWVWSWLGPDSSVTRANAGALLRETRTSISSLVSLGIFVVSISYLLWRFLCWHFWHKYFGYKDPPDEGPL